MDRIVESKRCPHCGRVLLPSDNPEYRWQCLDCDEDFYEVESRDVVVRFSEPTLKDIQPYINDDFIDFSQRVKVTVLQRWGGRQGYCFMERSGIERLGTQYIADHAELSYCELCGKYQVSISENDWYNDPVRNPEKVIPVKFLRVEPGTGREIYQGTDGFIYLREVYYPREAAAKWFRCGKRRRQDDGDPVHPNIVFECGGEREKVRYDDWNDVMAYSDTFNKNFRKKEVNF